MTGFAAAIRLRKRQLDALAMRLAGEQAVVNAILHQRDDLTRARAAERHVAAAVPLPCDPWFKHGERRLTAIGKAQAAAEQRLDALRQEAVQARARLQLLEDAAANAARAADRRRDAKAAAALDDRIAAAWVRR
ncbi:hypothetical protein V6R86_05350 [Sphingomonas kaistensis]|uniref:Flagellar FliJ protein n=1 Tax=Sphingomonas kaistensis TaxID=298708 RepID=A0ABZ2FZ63_9SPHN